MRACLMFPPLGAIEVVSWESAVFHLPGLKFPVTHVCLEQPGFGLGVRKLLSGARLHPPGGPWE